MLLAGFHSPQYLGSVVPEIAGRNAASDMLQA